MNETERRYSIITDLQRKGLPAPSPAILDVIADMLAEAYEWGYTEGERAATCDCEHCAHCINK
jgi:hypothetical protein